MNKKFSGTQKLCLFCQTYMSNFFVDTIHVSIKDDIIALIITYKHTFFLIKLILPFKHVNI